MNPRQKILFAQLQLAGLGIVIAIMAYILETPVLYPIGGAVFLFGIIRLMVLGRLTSREDFSDLPDDAAAFDWNKEEEEDGEEKDDFLGLL